MQTLPIAKDVAAVAVPLSKGLRAWIDQQDAELILGWPFAWCVDNYGYARATLIDDGVRKKVRMHRLILQFPAGMVDHRNLDRLDNRRDNLRLATRGQNQANKLNQEHGSRFKGVSRRTGCSTFIASLYHGGKRIHLGSFKTEEEAAQAYLEAAQQAFGEFARSNYAPA